MNEMARQFRGEKLRSVEASGLALVESRFRSGGMLPKHRHDHAFISFLLAGSQLQRLHRQERRCTAATVTWHPADEVHEDRFVSDGHILFLAFQGEWLETLPPDMPRLHRGCSWEGGPRYRLGLELYRGLNRGQPLPLELVVDLISLCVAAAPERGPSAWLSRILEWMNDECSDKLTLTQAAELAGVHPVHISRSFRRMKGCTFREYLTLIRLRRATDLLKRSSSQVTEIAFACGFSDHAHFTRTFKQATGLTPTAYRAQTG
jgi:AraC family transcriptional regulator